LRQRKVGLALSGGSARGLAHIGVLSVLEKEGIPIDIIAGTSMGAIVGAVYTAGKDINLIKKIATSLTKKRVFSLLDPTLPKTGSIKGEKFQSWLRSIIGDIDFDDLRIPFACVATDITTGEEVIIKEGSVLEGVRASYSMPIIFTPVRWQGRYLVDGGLVNPVPVRIAREMGADFVIAVNVSTYIADRTQGTNKEKPQTSKAPNIFTIITQTINIIEHQIAMPSLKQADVIITPEVKHIRSSDFLRSQECIMRGQQAARHAIPEIKEQLEG